MTRIQIEEIYKELLCYGSEIYLENGRVIVMEASISYKYYYVIHEDGDISYLKREHKDEAS